jgi:hypothetical protein
MRRGALLTLLVALAGALPAVAQDQEQSCRLCHPGPSRGLLAGVHRAQSCSDCHGDLGAHAASALRPAERQPVAVAKVAAASCVRCHTGRELAVALGAHPETPAGVAATPLQHRDAALLAEVAARQPEGAIHWTGLLDAGYRFVSVRGSRDRYASDLDLQPGARLRAAELSGDGGRDALLDRVDLRAHDIGDPAYGVSGRVERTGAFSAGASLERDRIRYAAEGNYHRVDRDDQTERYDLGVDVSRGVRVFADFEHRTSDGFWLTNRVGNINLMVQTTVEGVQSPRQFAGDDAELGFTATAGDLTFTLAGSYLDDHLHERWVFSRPSPVNPAFDESEDFASNSSLRGPGGRVGLAGKHGGLSWDLNARYRDLERRVAGSGVGTGYDVAQFTTTTASVASGSAATWLADGTASLQCAEHLAFVLDATWRDHKEDLNIAQTDVTIYPTLSTINVVNTLQSPHTAQRLLDASASLDWSPSDDLDVTLGFGGAWQWLRVPDLEAGDNDFLSGFTRDKGLLGGVTWRPAPGWKAVVRGRDFGQDGLALHELVDDSHRELHGSLGWQGTTLRVEPFATFRRSSNDIAQYRRDADIYGVTAGARAGTLDLSASYSWSHVDAHSLTNFYFDPNPNPFPTVVGFLGDTQTFTANLQAEPSAGVHWEIGAVWTTTSGGYDVTLADWHVDLRLQLHKHSATGVDYRQVHYSEAGGAGDYDAQLLFVYWRQTF